MFPSLHCDKSAKGLSHSQLGGANVLDMCTFKSAHTSDWSAHIAAQAPTDARMRARHARTR
jgi:hypothetical protein